MAIVFVVIGFLVIALLFLLVLYFKTLRERENRVRELFESWKKDEMESQRRLLADGVKMEYEAKLNEWIAKNEKEIREDAISKSKSVIMGKVTEHVVPYFEDFKYNPRDARFVGTPVDFIVFEGMSDGDINQISFVEVKTGKTGQLSKVERQIRDVIANGKVLWDKIHYKGSKTNAGRKGEIKKRGFF